MNMGRIISRLGIVSVCASAVVLSGCLASAEGEGLEEQVGEGLEEQVGEAEQAIGTECAGATATQSFTGSANWVSPQTYSTTSCYKAVVVDVNSIANVGGIAYATVYWADTAPTTQAACEASFVRMDMFEWVSGSWSNYYTDSAPGVWNSGTGTCQKPSVGTGVTPLHTFRFAITARLGDGTTQKVGISTGGIS
jgi:hypothetical protein